MEAFDKIASALMGKQLQDPGTINKVGRSKIPVPVPPSVQLAKKNMLQAQNKLLPPRVVGKVLMP